MADLGDVTAGADRTDPVAAVLQRHPQRRRDARASMSAKGARPAMTMGSDSSKSRRMPVATSSSDSPSSSSSNPSRLNRSAWAREGRDPIAVHPGCPSRPTRGARRGAARSGRRGRGSRPRRPCRTVIHMVKVGMCWRGGIRPLAEVGVQTPPRHGADSPANPRSRTIGTPRDRVGVSSNQCSEAESTISARVNASRHLRTPLRAHEVADDVAVEQRRRTRGARVGDSDEWSRRPWAPRCRRSRRTRGRPAAARRRRGGAATRRRRRWNGPGRRRGR